MSTKTMYFIVDANHGDYDQAKSDAEFAELLYVAANAKLSWRFNADETKAMVKVIGGEDDWWDGSPQYALKDSPLFLEVYDSTQHADFVTELAKAEWQPQPGSPTPGGSPTGSPG